MNTETRHLIEDLKDCGCTVKVSSSFKGHIIIAEKGDYKLTVNPLVNANRREVFLHRRELHKLALVHSGCHYANEIMDEYAAYLNKDGGENE